jgi:hypothetical protein
MSCQWTAGTGVPNTTLAISGSFNTPALTTSSVYTISCTGAGGSASKSATVTVNSGGACSSSGNTTAITLSNVPSRISGVAPLSVFFDATGTTATTTTIPFHELEYTWSFGDPAGGATWNYGSRTGVSKNTAKGPVAAHVFETAGTHYVSLSITDGTSTVSNGCTQITVQDPASVFAGTNTICVAASTLPVAGVDGCPTGAEAHTQSDFGLAVNTYATTGKRLLFKHDDVFTGTTGAAISITGPGIVGMYGTGAKPIMHVTSAYATLSFGAASGTMQDWRIMDLEIDGYTTPSSGGITAGNNADQITLLRVDVHNTVFGWNLSGDSLEYNATHPPMNTPHEFDQWTIQECNTYDMDGPQGNMGMYAFAHRFAILGSRFFHIINGEHTVRIEHAAKAVFSNNTMGDPAPTKQVFSLRAPSITDTGYQEYLPTLLPGTMSYTSDIVVSDNHFIAGRSGQPVDNKPSAPVYNAYFRDIIFERNYYTVGTSTACCSQMLGIRSQDLTVRNEIFDLTGAGTPYGHQVLSIDGATTNGPASNNVRIYNNTAFSNDANDFYFLDSKVSTGITVQNNFMYGPNAVSENSGIPKFYSNGSSIPALASNNTGDAQITSSSAFFTTVPPTAPAGFKPATGSYAISAGASVPVWSDFNLAPLTSSSTRDMGAIIH